MVVEVDGIQHTWVENSVGEALSAEQGSRSTDDTVLRLPVLGLRVCPDEFFAQIAEALSIAGCPLAFDIPA